MNWNNIFNAKTSKYKNPAKHPRYEVEKLGKIQHDIKVLTKDLTGLDRNYYVFDFIDEKSRFAIGYIYDSKGVTNAIGATRKAIQRFADIGIKVTRIRTDNGTEYISNLHKHATRKISEFTEFLNKKRIVHQTTPIRTPEANGKIERFHQNWNKFFYQVKSKCSGLKDLRKFAETFLNYYNNVRPHKSLKLKTPIQLVCNQVSCLKIFGAQYSEQVPPVTLSNLFVVESTK